MAAGPVLAQLRHQGAIVAVMQLFLFHMSDVSLVSAALLNGSAESVRPQWAANMPSAGAAL